MQKFNDAQLKEQPVSNNLKNEFDGILVTNCFGTSVNIEAYEDFCNENNKMECEGCGILTSSKYDECFSCYIVGKHKCKSCKKYTNDEYELCYTCNMKDKHPCIKCNKMTNKKYKKCFTCNQPEPTEIITRIPRVPKRPPIQFNNITKDDIKQVRQCLCIITPSP